MIYSAESYSPATRFLDSGNLLARPLSLPYLSSRSSHCSQGLRNLAAVAADIFIKSYPN